MAQTLQIAHKDFEAAIINMLAKMAIMNVHMNISMKMKILK